MAARTAQPSIAECVAAERLRAAADWREPCGPVRELIGTTDISAAYRVQTLNVAQRVACGHRVVGRKIGLTSPAVQAQLGVDQPDFGRLLEDMRVAPDGTADTQRLLQPKVEAEVAFVLGADLDGPLDSESAVRAAVAGVRASIEIVDSRVRDWDITITDTIADNASSGLFVLSDMVVPLDDVDPAAVQMTMWRNEVEVSTGSGSDCLGSPLLALLWLARACQEVGDPLRAGEVVLSGALGPMAGVRAGDRVEASITGLGPVSVNFG
jgi:2-keto-4-pentenoate hydratase